MGGYFMQGLASGIKDGLATKADMERRKLNKTFIDAQISSLKATTKAKEQDLKLMKVLQDVAGGRSQGGVSEVQDSMQIPNLVSTAQTAQGPPTLYSSPLGAGGAALMGEDQEVYPFPQGIPSQIATAQTSGVTNIQKNIPSRQPDLIKGAGLNATGQGNLEGAMTLSSFLRDPKNQIYRLMVREKYGFDLAEVKFLKKQEDPTGKIKGPVTLMVDINGKVLKVYPEAVKPETVEVEGPLGETGLITYDPYNIGNTPIKTKPKTVTLKSVQMEDGRTQIVPVDKFGRKVETDTMAVNLSTTGQSPLIEKQAEVERVVEERSGIQYSVLRYKLGGAKVPGSTDIKVKSMGATAAAQITNVEEVVIPAMKDLVNMVLPRSKDGDVKIPFSAKVQGTFPTQSAALGAEMAVLSTNVAFGLVRPESGAAINPDELTKKLSSFMPRAFTKPRFQATMFLRMGRWLDSFLLKVDTEYATKNGLEVIYQKGSAEKMFVEVLKENLGVSERALYNWMDGGDLPPAVDSDSASMDKVLTYVPGEGVQE